MQLSACSRLKGAPSVTKVVMTFFARRLLSQKSARMLKRDATDCIAPRFLLESASEHLVRSGLSISLKFFLGEAEEVGDRCGYHESHD